MLSVNQLSGFGARRSGSVGHTITFLDNQYRDFGANNVDVTVDLGAAAAGDKIVAVGSGQRQSSSADLSAMEIDGQSATVIAKVVTSASIVVISYFDDTSGVVGGSSPIRFEATGPYKWIAAAWRLTGSATGTPTAANVDTASGGTTLNTNVDIAANGIVISFAGDGAFGTTITWTNIDERFEQTGSNQVFCGGAERKFLTSETNQLIRAVYDSVNAPALVTASFDPA